MSLILGKPGAMPVLVVAHVVPESADLKMPEVVPA
jgi:hypothetical protein